MRRQGEESSRYLVLAKVCFIFVKLLRTIQGACHALTCLDEDSQQVASVYWCPLQIIWTAGTMKFTQIQKKLTLTKPQCPLRPYVQTTSHFALVLSLWNDKNALVKWT